MHCVSVCGTEIEPCSQAIDHKHIAVTIMWSTFEEELKTKQISYLISLKFAMM